MPKYSKGPRISLVIAAIVIVAGFIVWRFSQPAQRQVTGQNQSNQQSQKADPNAGYVVIKEWGVRFKPINNTGTVVYKAISVQGVPAGDGTGIPLPEGSVAISLSTQELIKLSADCGVGQDATGVWRLYRSPQPIGLSDNVSLGKVGSYYYYYFHAGAACVTDKADYDFNSSVSGLLHDSFKSLELIQ